MQHEHVLTKLNFDLLTPLPVHPGGETQALDRKITFDMFYIYSTSVCMRNFGKKILMTY